MWTAHGLHTYVGPAVSSAIAPGMRGMPTDLFAAPIVSLFMQKMAAADAGAVGYLKDSVCFKHTVRAIPVKPSVSCIAHPALHEVLRQSRDGMENFFPLGMLQENIGSNRGLLLILKDLFGVQPRPGHFSFLAVDCNIFLRLLKVIVRRSMTDAININGCVLLQFFYDSSGVGRGTGAWLCLSLGTWHPYKQANTVVWKHWAARFIAPFYNHIVPRFNFRGSARLVTISTFFTYIRLAVPHFAQQLHAAVKAARLKRDKPLVLAYLLDLRDLIYFAIPVVCH
jgi:hypothetical protein